MHLELLENAERDECLLVFKGVLDEKVVFPTAKIKLQNKLVFDCADLTHVDAEGSQKWVSYMRSLHPKQQFVFRGCHGNVMRLMFVMPDFLPALYTVDSFYIPYECVQCEHVEEVLVVRGKDYLEKTGDFPSRRHFPEIINCAKCKSEMKMSIIDSRYFNFLESHQDYV